MSLLLQDGTNLLLQDGTNLLLQAGAPPIFTVQPVDATVTDGQGASFTVLAESDTVPITYQWYEVGVGALGGETGTTLVLPPLGIADTGREFYCTATNDAGSTDSNTALLTVNKVTLGITLQPASQTIVETETVTFTAEAVGKAPISYQWYDNLGILVGETGQTLSFQTSLSDDGREFYFVAQDGYTDTLSSDVATLTIAPLAGVDPNLIRIKAPSGQWITFIDEAAYISTYAYGGVKRDDPVAISDITVSYQTIPFDAEVLSAPSLITQDSANNGIRFLTEGVYRVAVSLVLEHAGSAAGSRRIDVRLYNSTDAAIMADAPWSVGRNDEVTAVTASLLVEIDAGDIGDLIQLEIGNASADVTGVTVRAARIEANSVSALG